MFAHQFGQASERADGIGATIHITSEPGAGTTLVVETSTEPST